MSIIVISQAQAATPTPSFVNSPLIISEIVWTLVPLIIGIALRTRKPIISAILLTISVIDFALFGISNIASHVQSNIAVGVIYLILLMCVKIKDLTHHS